MFARGRYWLGVMVVLVWLTACARQPALPSPAALSATPRRGTITPGIVLPPTWTLAPTLPPTLTATLRPTRTPSPTHTATPTITPSPTRPTPTLSPDLLASLRIVYTWNDRLYLWQNWVTTTVSVTAGVARPLLSDDGQWVAFVRGEALWAARLDGGAERRLVSAEDFAALPPRDPGVSLHRFDWLPGTHTLLFNTRLRSDYGVELNDDLYRVDVETGVWRAVALPGEGGECYPSPDGQRLACVTPNSIAVMDIGGRARQTVLTYEPVYTYSEFEYYASPLWASDSRSLYVAIPPKDPLGIPTEPTVVWRLALDGSDAMAVAQLVVAQGWVSLSPDLTRLAYHRFDEGGIRVQLHLAMLDSQEDSIYALGQVGFLSWAPDSRHFAFWKDNWSNVWVGEWGGEALPLGDPRLVGFRWVDESHLLYYVGDYAHQQLRMAIPGELSVLLLERFDDYDFIR